MSQPANTKHIPSIRFPEFSGVWEKTHIGKVLTIGSGKDYKHLLSGDVPVYGTGGYMLSVNDFLYDGESVCIGRKGTIDKPVFVTGKFWTVDTLFYTHSFENVLPKFIYACFQRVNWKLYNEASGVPSLSKTTIEGIGLNIPSLPEQTKIAAFLSTVDSKIDQLSQKKTLLEQYKKGVMQQLFSQQIRFKADDGCDYPEWEEKKLGEVVSNIGGTALEKYVGINCVHKFISIGNYTVDGKYYDNGQRVELNSKSKEKLLNKHDLVMVLNDKTSKGDIIGSTILVDADNSYIYNQRSERLICKNIIYPIYLWFYLNSERFRKIVFSIAQGGTQIYVNFSAVKELMVFSPSIEEQTKIANFLSAIDSKIEQVAQQLETAKQFKKGLLQQMFV